MTQWFTQNTTPSLKVITAVHPSMYSRLCNGKWQHIAMLLMSLVMGGWIGLCVKYLNYVLGALSCFFTVFISSCGWKTNNWAILFDAFWTSDSLYKKASGWRQIPCWGNFLGQHVSVSISARPVLLIFPSYKQFLHHFSVWSYLLFCWILFPDGSIILLPYGGCTENVFSLQVCLQA